MVYAGNYSCGLFSGAGDLDHQTFARISQAIYVDPATTILQFNVAAVLNGAHATTPGEDAYFQVSALDAGGNPLITQTYMYAASPSPLVDDGVIQWKHLPWTPLNFGLGAYVGTTVTLQFEVHDCALAGHYCYAFVDGFELVPTYTTTVTPSITPTSTQSPTATVTPTLTATPTFSDTCTETPTKTITPTYTDTPSATPTPTCTDTPTVTMTPTITATFSASPSFTASPSITPTFSISPTFSRTCTPVVQAGPVEISSPYPDPFRDTLHVVVVLKTPATIDIRVYNVAGEPVYDETLPRPAGVSVWNWNGSNLAGRRLASGVYIIRAEVPGVAGPPSFLRVVVAR